MIKDLNKFKRIHNPTSIDRKAIQAALDDGNEVIVQFVGKTYTDKMLFQLNELCYYNGDNFGVRFYGHYSGYFDAKTVLKLPDIKWLLVDCLTLVDHITALTELSHLKRMSLGFYELRETEILNSPNFQSLTDLIITETKTKALNLEYLKYCHELKSLVIGNHSKNIDAIGELGKLEFLSLNSVKKTSVSFINRLKNLKTLKFILGGRANIHEIGENEIEELEIVWVRGFNDISNISKFRNLKTLKIEDQIQLAKIHFDIILPHLAYVCILNCKTLNSITGLDNLPLLNLLRVWKTNVDFDNFIQQDLPKNLKTLEFFTTKSKTDALIKDTLIKKGYFSR